DGAGLAVVGAAGIALGRANRFRVALLAGATINNVLHYGRRATTGATLAGGDALVGAGILAIITTTILAAGVLALATAVLALATAGLALVTALAALAGATAVAGSPMTRRLTGTPSSSNWPAAPATWTRPAVTRRLAGACCNTRVARPIDTKRRSTCASEHALHPPPLLASMLCMFRGLARSHTNDYRGKGFNDFPVPEF